MGASGNKLSVTTPSDREIVMTRVFDAPRDLVFEAHSSCEHMSNWWGPRKYEFASCEIDFRAGGKWRIVHRGPAGEDDHGFRGEFREIVPPEDVTEDGDEHPDEHEPEEEDDQRPYDVPEGPIHHFPPSPSPWAGAGSVL